MFRDEYRKANDSIHAPDHLLDSIKAEADRSFVMDTRPRRRWPSAVIYSGCAVAVAALALLVFRPFSFSRKADAVAVTAETKAYDTALGENGSMQLFSAGASVESPMLAAPAGEPVEGYPESEAEEAAYDRVERTDGDEDEYYIFNNEPEMTYETVFNMLIPGQTDNAASKKNVVTESASASVWTEGSVLNAYGNSYELPEGRDLRALVEAWDNVYVISEENGSVVTSVYTKDGYAGETKQSGYFVSYEVRQTTVFDDDYSLSDHNVVIINSLYTPDPDKMDIDVPSSFVPVFTDQDGERPLNADDITCVNESSTYSVYGAVDVNDGVRMLYIFAELG